MSAVKRAVIMVFDGFGAGALPDAPSYGDAGSHTIDNVSRAVGKLHIPNLVGFGLGLIEGINAVEKTLTPIASYGRMREVSPGKDTETGHWEMSGVILDKPFPTYPGGFPPEIMERFTKATGYGWLGNCAASGTKIIEALGAEHIRTGRLIVYTSADSVFQIAGHVDVIPVEELYRVCEIARELLYEYNIGRVIARPFAGHPGDFRRTDGRRDYSLAPCSETIIEKIKAAGQNVVGIGKIGDIFAHRGLTFEAHTKNNMDGIDKTIAALKESKTGLIFTNLGDFDTLYGHRNDAVGYANALFEADARLPEIIAALDERDVFIITGDHGCDPTTQSTDHSREYVPLLVYGKGLKPGVNLGTRLSFADVGATLAEVFSIKGFKAGKSFFSEILM
ncbi:MAG: phosphopentomutase [Deltaproteobacteria bacterium]|nr:phosphopentomutase [Deltaproteobacteria bacterium]